MVRRRGLLDEIPYVRLIRGAVIVPTEDAGRVTAFLEGFGSEAHRRTIELTPEDRHLLGAQSRD